MGNNNGACFLRLRGSLPFPSNIQLGTDATINMKTISLRSSGRYVESAEVLYTVEGSNCELVLGRTTLNDGNIYALSFTLHDSIISSGREQLSFPIFKEGTDFLDVFHRVKYSNLWTKTTKNVDAWSGVTDTKICLYGTSNRCGLLVLECKNDCPHQRKAKAVTIAHYFVSSNGSVAVNRSSETTDIGFSVVTKVRRCDGKFDITVEGPEPHPVSALLYMFGEVSRTGIWKPSMCPHCRNIRREHYRMFLQSDSEDSDGRRQHPVTIDNGGRFRGHGCGARVRGDFIVNN